VGDASKKVVLHLLKKEVCILEVLKFHALEILWFSSNKEKVRLKKPSFAMSKDTFHRWPCCSSHSFPSNKFIHFEV